MNLQFEIKKIKTAKPFRIARGETFEKEIILVRLGNGIGEGAAYTTYGETIQGNIQFLEEKILPVIKRHDPFEVQIIHDELEKISPYFNSIKSAVDMAVYDHIGKELGVPVYRYLGITPEPIATSYTIGIDDIEIMQKDVEKHLDFEVFKIKVGTGREMEVIKAIREVTKKPLRLDANEGWTAKEAVWKVNKILETFDNIEFIEQPVPRWDIRGLKYVRENVPIPVIADESFLKLKDLPAIADAVDGVNVKLAKCGGITEAIRIVHTARAYGLKLMLGSMVETSLAITAAAHIAPLFEYVDLDGNLLLAEDPFRGVEIESGRLVLNDLPGLGVRS